MTPEEITALAREYGEHEAKTYSMDSDTKRELYKKVCTNVAESVLGFLSHRYCLVEKEAVRKEYQDATTHVKEAIKSKNPFSESCGKGKRIAIQSLFPEIAKEVEG